MAPVVSFDLPIFGAGILFGWSVFIVAGDLLGLASVDARRLGRFLTVLLLLSIAGGLALLAVHHAAPTTAAAPCRGHAARR
jgi:hypothetical protein